MPRSGEQTQQGRVDLTDDGRPLYVAMAAHLADCIDREIYTRRLPSVRQLQEIYNVSQWPTTEALKLLTAAKYVEVQPGSGTRVLPAEGRLPLLPHAEATEPAALQQRIEYLGQRIEYLEGVVARLCERDGITFRPPL